jgi:hypothetical protein
LAQALPYPNPSTDGSTNLYYELKNPMISVQAGPGPVYYDPGAVVTLSIHSFSKRLIWKKVIRGAKTGGNSEFWDGFDLKGAPLSNGTYIYRAQVSSRGHLSEKDQYLMILR